MADCGNNDFVLTQINKSNLAFITINGALSGCPDVSEILEPSDTPECPGKFWIKQQVTPHLTFLDNIDPCRFGPDLRVSRDRLEKYLQTYLQNMFGSRDSPFPLNIDATDIDVWKPPSAHTGPDYRCIVLKLTLPSWISTLRDKMCNEIPRYSPWGFNPHVTLTYVVPNKADNVVSYIKQRLPTIKFCATGFRVSVHSLEI